MLFAIPIFLSDGAHKRPISTFGNLRHRDRWILISMVILANNTDTTNTPGSFHAFSLLFRGPVDARWCKICLLHRKYPDLLYVPLKTWSISERRFLSFCWFHGWKGNRLLQARRTNRCILCLIYPFPPNSPASVPGNASSSGCILRFLEQTLRTRLLNYCNNYRLQVLSKSIDRHWNHTHPYIFLRIVWIHWNPIQCLSCLCPLRSFRKEAGSQIVCLVCLRQSLLLRHHLEPTLWPGFHVRFLLTVHRRTTWFLFLHRYLFVWMDRAWP